MTYAEALKYLQTLPFYEKKDTVFDRMRKMLTLLNVDLKKTKYVHVTGSKGKGSVSMMMARACARAGYKVGLFISPQIHDHTDRIRILQNDNEKIISKKTFSSYVDKIKKTSELERIPLGIFEIFTLIGLTHFISSHTDIVVMEVGMGGRLDPTNIIPSKTQIITNIELEHTEILGDTIEKIAYEKSGIIKPDSICVLGDMQQSALDICSEKGKQMQSKIIVVENCDYELIHLSKKGMMFHVIDFGILNTHLLGEHQCENATLAIYALKALKADGFCIPDEAIKLGICETRIPFRMEIKEVNEKTFLLDGCHTVTSINYFFETAKKIFPTQKKSIIIGFSKRKNLEQLCETFARNIDDSYQKIIVTKPRHKGEDEKRTKELIEKYMQKKVIVFSAITLNDALKYCDINIVMIIGSLYLCSDFSRRRSSL